MNLLDLVIIVVMFYMATRWSRIGLVQGVFSLLGFLGGLLLGAWIAPYLLGFITDTNIKLVLSVLIIVISGAVVSNYGERIGRQLKSKQEKARLKRIDSFLGGLFSILLTAIYVWAFSAILGGSPYKTLNQSFRQSRIVQSVNQALPPAPAFLARIGILTVDFDFPQVFIGAGPEAVTPVAPLDSTSLQTIVNLSGASVVRVQGYGCGGLSFGSGFVAAPNLIITNAHVVAGTSNISVTDTAGRHVASVVYFDPDLDLAILRSSHLVGTPLKLATSIQPRGTVGGVLGFPGGGNFTSTEAAILRQMTAQGLNIYGQRNVSRQIYELQAKIEKGDSGGPVVGTDGTVIGVTFAQSLSTPGIGYALTSISVRPGLATAMTRTAEIGTGQCTSD